MQWLLVAAQPTPVERTTLFALQSLTPTHSEEEPSAGLALSMEFCFIVDSVLC